MAKGLNRAFTLLPAAGLAVVASQIYRAGHRRDLPSHPNQDPSGTFGHPGNPVLRMVAVGDSSITCPGVEELDACFVRRVAIHLSDRFSVELHSVAVGGARVREVLAAQLQRAIALRPQLALVSVGSNDALRATPVAAYERDLDAVVAALHEEAAAVVVMGVGDLGNIPRLPGTFRPFLTWRSRQIDQATTRVVDRYKRATRSDTWGRMSVAFGTRDLELWAGDRFHASGRGHAVFAAEVIPAVEKVVPLLPHQDVGIDRG